MSISTSNMNTEKQPDLDAAVRRRFVQIGILVLIQAAALFLVAGRIDWPAGWVYVLVYMGFIAVNTAILLPRAKDLIAERAELKADAR